MLIAGLARGLYSSEVHVCLSLQLLCACSAMCCVFVIVAVLPQVWSGTHASAVCCLAHCAMLTMADHHMHRWMAPESFLDGVTTVRSDIFMFGVLLWGMAVCVVCKIVPLPRRSVPVQRSLPLARYPGLTQATQRSSAMCVLDSR